MRRIAQETINKVLEEVDIFEVVSQYVDLKKRGRRFIGFENNQDQILLAMKTINEREK